MKTHTADITLTYKPSAPIKESGDIRTFIEAEIHLNAKVTGPELGHYDVDVECIYPAFTHIKLIRFDEFDIDTITYEGKLVNCPAEWLKLVKHELDYYAEQEASDIVLEKVMYAAGR
jgi:hypothetical protein